MHFINLKIIREFKLAEFINGFSSPLNLTDDGLFRLGEIGVHFLKENGLEGIVALPAPYLIDPITGEDLRISGDNELVIQLWVSVLNEVQVELIGLKKKEELRIKKIFPKMFSIMALKTSQLGLIFLRNE